MVSGIQKSLALLIPTLLHTCATLREPVLDVSDPTQEVVSRHILWNTSGNPLMYISDIHDSVKTPLTI